MRMWIRNFLKSRCGVVSLVASAIAPVAAFVCLFSVTCTVTPVDPVNPPPVVPTYSIRYYLGYGYDVLNSSYINRSDVKVAYPILDQERMIGDNLIVSDAASISDFQAFVGADIHGFSSDKNVGINVDFSDNVLIAFFSGKLSAEFSMSTKESNANAKSYLRGRAYSYTQDEYIRNAAPTRLLNYLTDDFAADLKAKSPDSLFDRYGTHVLVRYYKGGALEFNYVYQGKKLATTEDMRVALNASFFGISGVASYETNSERLELEQNSTLHYYTYGGAGINAFGVDDLKGDYRNWQSSIPSKADICGIGDFGQSLIPLWELAETNGYNDKAKTLKEVFIRRALDLGKTLSVGVASTELTVFDSAGTFQYRFNGADTVRPAYIEIYALGAGGGGQGGNDMSAYWSSDYRGTGGAGGGGAAAYMALTVNRPDSFSITIGKGGNGGNRYSGSDDKSGSPGTNGEPTSVNWAFQKINLVVEGGTGGGGPNANVSGGLGGRASVTVLPYSNSYYKGGLAKSGENGADGSLKKEIVSEGGNAAVIDTGSAIHFGGGNGARRTGSGTAAAQNGGGGSGSYGASNGSAGGNGMVYIIYTIAK